MWTSDEEGASGAWETLCWWAAGVPQGIMESKACSTDRRRYVDVGGFVLLTSSWAAVAAWVVSGHIDVPPWARVAAAAFWATLIFRVERMIVSGLRHRASLPASRVPILFGLRVGLALVVAVPLAEVVILEIVRGEVTLEQEIQRSALLDAQRDSIAALYPAIPALQTENARLDEELARRRRQVADLEAEAVGELDGTRGSAEVGEGPIYRVKRSVADAARAELRSFEVDVHEQVVRNKAKVATLEATMQTDLNRLEEQYRGQGLLAQFVALGAVRRRHGRVVDLFTLALAVIFLTVELTPVMAKALAGRTTVDARLDRIETEAIAKEEDARDTASLDEGFRKGLRRALAAGAEATIVSALETVGNDPRARRRLEHIVENDLATLLQEHLTNLSSTGGRTGRRWAAPPQAAGRTHRDGFEEPSSAGRNGSGGMYS